MRLFQVLDTPPNPAAGEAGRGPGAVPARERRPVRRSGPHPGLRYRDAPSTARRRTVRLDGDFAGHLRRAVPVGHGAGRPPRPGGATYTTEKNILKVIEPLFLDDLRGEFRRLQARRDGRAAANLRKFRDKLGSLRLFDPACGCGNFLIIAYRELRTLEIDVLREIASRATATQLALAVQSVVEVDQFYGIEIGEFPARIAATALWMMDHIMNNRLSLRVRPDLRADPDREVAAHSQRRRPGDRLGRRATAE